MSRQGTIRRYTLIIEKINRNQFPSFQEIKDFLDEFGFNVSRRTIERDISAIRNEFGMEITYNKNKQGYYIDYENSINVESFLRFLEIVNTAELLSESLAESKETLNYISFDTGNGMTGIEYLSPLLQAIKEHRKISFKHRSFQSGKRRKYTLSPYLLKEYENRWYIIGMVSGMNQMRTFGVERIDELEVKTSIFKPNKNLVPQDFFKHTIGVVYSLNKIQDVILSFTPAQGKYIKSLPLHESQVELIDNDKEYRIQLTVTPNYELSQKILMFGNTVKVIEPKSLVEEIKQTLTSALAKY